MPDPVPAGEPAVRLRARLDAGLARLDGVGDALDDSRRERLVQFVQLLAKWNRVHNLTAVREVDEMVSRHLLDSLALLPSVSRLLPPAADGATARPAHPDVLDIGSGAGLPVLPLAIARPDLQWLSVDAVAKKVRFQRQAVLELQLSNVEAQHARIETLTTRARVVVSRAFASPDAFLTVAGAHCVEGGAALVMLGRRDLLPMQLPAPFQLGEIRALDIPFSEGERHVAVCHAC